MSCDLVATGFFVYSIAQLALGFGNDAVNLIAENPTPTGEFYRHGVLSGLVGAVVVMLKGQLRSK